MEKGEIRFHGPTAELLDRPDLLRSVFLEGVGCDAADGERRPPARPGPRSSPWRRSATATPADGRRGGRRDRGRDPGDGCERSVTPALEVVEVSVRFGGIQAVERGVARGRAGRDRRHHRPQRRGQDHAVRPRSPGFTRADAGRVLLGGRDLTRRSPDVRARAGLGRSFQDARLFPALTVEETIAVALDRWVEVKDPLNPALHLPAAFDSEQMVASRVAELIDLLHLEAYRTKFVRELSTGSRRVVDLACVVAHRPSVVLLDEPSSGIAQREAEALGPLLLRLRDELGCQPARHRARHAARHLGRRPPGRPRPGSASSPTDRPDEVLHDPVVVSLLPRRQRSRHRPFGRHRDRDHPSREGTIHATDHRHRRRPSTALRRYGPIIAIVVVIVVVAAVVVVNRGNSSDSTATGTTSTTAAGGFHPAGVVSWSAGQGGGQDEVDRLGEPLRHHHAARSSTRATSPARATARSHGDNGGATAQGVTGDVDQGRALPGAGERPDPEVHRGLDRRHRHQRADGADRSRTGSTSTRPTTRPTGARCELVPFTATGSVGGRGGGPRRRHADRRVDQAVRGHRRAGADRRLRQPARRPTRSSASSACPSQPNTLLRRALALRPRPGHERGRAPGARGRVHRQASSRATRRSTPASPTCTRRTASSARSTSRPARTPRRQQKHFETSLAKLRRPPRPGAGVSSHPTKLQTDAPGLIAKLKAAGDTSVIFVGDPVAPGPITKAATGQDYFPEWIVTGSAADRHDDLRPHLRPEAVVARLRRVVAGRPHRPVGQRRPLHLQLVLRAQAAGQDRRHRSSPPTSTCSSP